MKKKISLIALAAVFIVGMVALGCAPAKSKVSLPAMKALLQNHALVVAYDNGAVLTYDENGIKPLFNHLDRHGNFKDCYIFDKVTGKASALVLAYGGAASLHTGVLSKEAIPVLEQYNIEYTADLVVDFIVNQKKDDKCPMEKTVASIDNPEEAYKILREKFGK